MADLAALFDTGLITFTATGVMPVSPRLRKDERATPGLAANLRKRPNPRQAEYLQYHVENVFRTKV